MGPAGRALLGLALLALASAEASAALPEVQNLRFEDRDTVVWDPVPFATGYDVYRSTLPDVRAGDYGTCYLGSVRGTRARIPEAPAAPGDSFTILVAAFDESGEGSVGGQVSTACVPARRFFDLTINGDPGDGVQDGAAPRENPSVLAWGTRGITTAVDLHTGQFRLGFSGPLRVSTAGNDRGISWHRHSFTRQSWLDYPDEKSIRYYYGPPRLDVLLPPTPLTPGGLRDDLAFTSQARYNGPVGQSFDAPFNARVLPSGSNIVHCEGTMRCDTFIRLDATRFRSPRGQYAVLRQNGDGSFTLRDPHGTLTNFHALDGSNTEGAIESVEDRNGRLVSFRYDHQALMNRTYDRLGREVLVGYHDDPGSPSTFGRIRSITDWAGRTWTFAYDAAGDLVAVTDPAGSTVTLGYSSGFADERLNHNLTSVIAPNEHGSGVPVVQVTYGTDPLNFDFDRVVSQTIGGTNSSGVLAGGTLTYAYGSLNPGADPNDPTIPRRRCDFTDRNGNFKQFWHNAAGNRIRSIEYTNRELRPGEGDYVADLFYNQDGQLVQYRLPNGNFVQIAYDTPGLDRYREGNPTQICLVADPLRGDGHGGGLNAACTTFTYEPLYNQVRTVTEPRGNDSAYVPQNGGVWDPSRYTSTRRFDFQEGPRSAVEGYAMDFGIDLTGIAFDLGDLNGDGDTSQTAGNPVRVELPAVQLDPSSQQAAIEGDTSQESVTLLRWNAHGQPTAVVDAEGNRHEYDYYLETDPDGDGVPTPAPPDRTLDPVTGGYLKTARRDVASSPGRDNGTDPAPASLQVDFGYDEAGNLRDVVDARGVRIRRIHDALGRVVEERRAAATADASGPDGDAPTGRGETGLTAFGHKVLFEYDANGNLMKSRREDRGATRGMGPFLDTRFIYDILNDLVEMQEQPDPTTSLSTRYRYDANQNRTQLVEPAGTATEWSHDERDLLLSVVPGASGPRGGLPAPRSYDYDASGNLLRMTDARGGIVDYGYDGHDRLARVTDQVGSTADLFYDPAGNLLRRLHRGPVGGPTPPDRSGSTNVDLADLRRRLNERHRLFRSDLLLFVPSGAPLARPAMLQEGSLDPGDGAVNRVYEYDRLDRLSFLHADSGALRRHDYDGAGRLLRATLPDGSTVERTYDGNGNVVETARTEMPSAPGPPSELFLTTHFYDALNRLAMTVNPLGNTWRRYHDSLDAVTTLTDPRGPAGGSINRRSPGHTGTSVAINDDGNVTLYTYDALGRRVREERVLTASGQGDGTTSPPPDTSNPHNPDGLIRVSTSWDANSLVASRKDDRGNATTYAYDNLDRLVQTTRPDATLTTFEYDAEGNLVRQTDANGTQILNTHDPANRLAQRDVTPAVGVEGTTRQTFEHDGLGRVTRAVDNNQPGDLADDVTVTRTYDSLDRTLEEGQEISGGTLYTDLGWRAEDLLTDLVYPSGRRLQYGYDAPGRRVTVADPSRPETVSYEYFGPARVHTMRRGNLVRSTTLDNLGTSDIGYDRAGRPVLVREVDAANTLLTGFEYRYGPAGHRASERWLHLPDGMGNAKGRLYNHDSAGRLASYQEGFLDASHVLVSLPTEQVSWTLDGDTNREDVTLNGVLYNNTPNNLCQHNEPQCCGTATDDGIPDDFFDPDSTPFADGRNFAYDASGNQTNLGNFTLKVDFQGRPVVANRNADSAQVGAYAHDAFGRLAKRSVTNSGTLDETRRYFPSLDLVETRPPLVSIARWPERETLNLVAEVGGVWYEVELDAPGGEEPSFFDRHIYNLEERDAVGGVVRQVAPGATAEPVWQLHGDGTSQYFGLDVLGSVVALTDDSAPIVLRLFEYTPDGKPFVDDAAGNRLVDGAGNPLPESDLGNSELWQGWPYLPELGSRSSDAARDDAGLYDAEPTPSGLRPNLGFYGGTPQASKSWFGAIELSSNPYWYSPDQGGFVAPDASYVLPSPGSDANAYSLPGGDPLKSLSQPAGSAIRVAFPWLSSDRSCDEDSSCWIRVATTAAGPGRGFYHLPEVNDEVLVAFSEGDLHRPYVIGALWNTYDPPPGASVGGGASGDPLNTAIQLAPLAGRGVDFVAGTSVATPLLIAREGYNAGHALYDFATEPLSEVEAGQRSGRYGTTIQGWRMIGEAVVTPGQFFNPNGVAVQASRGELGLIPQVGAWLGDRFSDLMGWRTTN